MPMCVLRTIKLSIIIHTFLRFSPSLRLFSRGLFLVAWAHRALSLNRFRSHDCNNREENLRINVHRFVVWGKRAAAITVYISKWDIFMRFKLELAMPFITWQMRLSQLRSGSLPLTLKTFIRSLNYFHELLRLIFIFHTKPLMISRNKHPRSSAFQTSKFELTSEGISSLLFIRFLFLLSTRCEIYFQFSIKIIGFRYAISAEPKPLSQFISSCSKNKGLTDVEIAEISLPMKESHRQERARWSHKNHSPLLVTIVERLKCFYDEITFRCLRLTTTVGTMVTDHLWVLQRFFTNVPIVYQLVLYKFQYIHKEHLLTRTSSNSILLNVCTTCNSLKVSCKMI